jgi:putative endopeptidase
MLLRSIAIGVTIATVACASSQPKEEPVVTQPPSATAPANPAPVAKPKPEIGDFGFDTAGMDTSVKPGMDFYRYSNGKWLDSTEIPADRGAFGMFHRLDELSKARTREIIEESARANAQQGTETQKVGDFFATFMDEAAIEAAGTAPIKGDLAKVSAIANRHDLSRVLGEFQAEFTETPLAVSIGPDDKDPSKNIAQFWQSGLGLPDRDYYLNKKEPELQKFRDAYKKHIAAMLKLAGIAKADEKAKGIFAFEEKLAQVHWSRVDSRDATKVYNKWSRADFDNKAKGIDWTTFFAANHLEGQPFYLVSQPSTLIATSKLVGSEKLDVWKDYLTFRVIDDAASLLPKAFVDEDFDFNGRTLGGVPQIKERWKRGVELISSNLGEAVGKLYVAKYFPPESKAAAQKLVSNLIAAMHDRLGRLEWMAPETRVKAQEKLASFTPKIGYPDKWRDYSALSIDRSSVYENARRAARFEYARNVAKLGAAVDHSEWFMTPMMINAYANPVWNEIVFPAAIMQPPFFDANADDAVNYGGIGAVIGHEMSHHFDDQGRKYDKNGKLGEDWWTPEDVKRFEALTNQVVSQYNQYEPIQGLHVNGELTLGENIADLAGLTVAYDAYHKALDGKDAAVIDGFSGDQRFFEGWAQVWRIKYRDQTLRKLLMTDPHSPGMARALVVRNLDPWYPAFGVAAGEANYTAPEARIRIW